LVRFECFGSKEAKKLALIFQGYFYEGMANQNASPDKNFILKEKTKKEDIGVTCLA